MWSFELKEVFGAQFPSYTEVHHLMTLRLVLVNKMRTFPERSSDWYRLSNAGNFVGGKLRTMNVDPRGRETPKAPSDLLQHYNTVVCLHWRWLSDLLK